MKTTNSIDRERERERGQSHLVINQRCDQVEVVVDHGIDVMRARVMLVDGHVGAIEQIEWLPFTHKLVARASRIRRCHCSKAERVECSTAFLTVVVVCVDDHLRVGVLCRIFAYFVDHGFYVIVSAKDCSAARTGLGSTSAGRHGLDHWLRLIVNAHLTLRT